MAFPTRAATNTSKQDTDVTDHVVSLPDNIGTGDVIVVLFACDGGPTVTYPASPAWTLLDQWTTASTLRAQHRYRVVDGSEGWGAAGNTITITTSDAQESAHISLKYRGYTSPPVMSNENSGVSTAPDPPNLAPAGGALDYQWLTVVSWDDGTTTVSVDSTGYTSAINSQNTDSTGVGIRVAFRDENITNKNPAAGTLTASEGWLAHNGAIPPGSEGGTDPSTFVPQRILVSTAAVQRAASW